MDEFQKLMMEKEKELHDLASSRIKSLEMKMKEKDSENEKLKRMYEKIRQDFRFNLDVIDERDAELERYDKAFDNVKQVVMLRDAEIKELKIEIRKLRDKLKDVSEDQRTHAENFQDEMTKMERDLEIANEKIQSESKRRRNAEMMYQDFQKLHRTAVRNEENVLSDLRKQLEQDFERRVLEMKERFEAERAQWEAQSLALRNAAQSAQARSTQEINRIKEDMRLEVHSLEKNLKVTKWELEDERKMRVETDQERASQIRSEETVLNVMKREYETRLAQFERNSKDMEGLIETQKDRILMEEAEIQMLRSSSVATSSEAVAHHRRELLETTTRHREILEERLRVASKEYAKRTKQFEQQVARQEEESREIRLESQANVETLQRELAKCRQEVREWKRSSKSKRTMYEADIAHKQALLSTVEKDLDSLAKQFAKRTGSLRRECDMYEERVRKFEGSSVSLENYERRAEEDRMEQDFMSRQLRSVYEELSEMKRSVQVQRSEEIESLKQQCALIVRERDTLSEEIRRKDRIDKEKMEELKRMYDDVVRERDSLRNASSKNHFAPSLPSPTTSPVSKLRLVVPPVSPAFSDDMGPASPLPSIFSPSKSPSHDRKSSPTQNNKIGGLELQMERDRNEKNRQQIEEMRKEMISAKQINENLKKAVKEMRREMEKIVISTQQNRDEDDDREEENMSSIHNLRNEVEKMKRKMKRMEREREQLMEINKKRRWEKSNTFEWAREAWATIHNDDDDDDDDVSVDETDALSPDLSEYTQIDSVDKSLVALRDIERRALESCDGIQTKTKESSEKSQDTEKLILEHSNALLRAMRVKKPEILEMQGKRVSSSSSTSKRRTKKKNSDKMTASQREAYLSVTGSSKMGNKGRRQRVVRNYNIKD
eukprot:g6376.t1